MAAVGKLYSFKALFPGPLTRMRITEGAGNSARRATYGWLQEARIHARIHARRETGTNPTASRWPGCDASSPSPCCVLRSNAYAGPAPLVATHLIKPGSQYDAGASVINEE